MQEASYALHTNICTYVQAEEREGAYDSTKYTLGNMAAANAPSSVCNTTCPLNSVGHFCLLKLFKCHLNWTLNTDT